MSVTSSEWLSKSVKGDYLLCSSNPAFKILYTLRRSSPYKCDPSAAMSNNRPSFNVPAGAVAKVSIIDSTVRLAGLKVDYLCKPEVDGFEEFKAMPSWSFLVENSSGKKALFDLGVRVDLSKLVPRIQKNLEKYGWKPGTKENVADNIKRHGVDPQEIGSVIWR